MLFGIYKISAYFFQNVQVELVNLVVFFQGLNKIGRREESIFAVIPSCKSFQSAEFSCLCIYYRLIVDLDALFFNCIVNIVDYVLKLEPDDLCR